MNRPNPLAALRLPSPLRDWRAFEAWATVALFALWGALATYAALLRSFLVQYRPDGTSDATVAAVAMAIGGWSGLALIPVFSLLAVLLARRRHRVWWLPATGVALLWLLWLLGTAIGRHAG